MKIKPLCVEGRRASWNSTQRRSQNCELGKRNRGRGPRAEQEGWAVVARAVPGGARRRQVVRCAHGRAGFCPLPPAAVSVVRRPLTARDGPDTALRGLDPGTVLFLLWQG